MSVVGTLVMVTCHRHAVLELSGRAPDAPPLGFGFEEIAEGIVRGLLLERAGFLDCEIATAGIDVVDNRGDIGRKRKIDWPRGVSARGNERNQECERERTQEWTHGFRTYQLDSSLSRRAQDTK